MTIRDYHPIVTALAEYQGAEFVPVGSRFFRTHHEVSDYDFLCACSLSKYTGLGGLKAYLLNLGFKGNEGGWGYLKDGRLDAALTWTDPAGKLPAVDVLVASEKEVARRLKVFEAMRQTPALRDAMSRNKDLWIELFEIVAKVAP